MVRFERFQALWPASELFFLSPDGPRRPPRLGRLANRSGRWTLGRDAPPPFDDPYLDPFAPFTAEGERIFLVEMPTSLLRFLCKRVGLRLPFFDTAVARHLRDVSLFDLGTQFTLPVVINIEYAWARRGVHQMARLMRGLRERHGPAWRTLRRLEPEDAPDCGFECDELRVATALDEVRCLIARPDLAPPAWLVRAAAAVPSWQPCLPGCRRVAEDDAVGDLAGDMARDLADSALATLLWLRWTLEKLPADSYVAMSGLVRDAVLIVTKPCLEFSRCHFKRADSSRTLLARLAASINVPGLTLCRRPSPPQPAPRPLSAPRQRGSSQPAQ